MRYEIEIYTEDGVICKECNGYNSENGIFYLYKSPDAMSGEFFFCYKLRAGESIRIYDKEED